MRAINLARIKKVLNGEKPELLEKYSVSKIGVFGSYAFGDYKTTSDIDILVEFKKQIGLFKFVELEDYLSEKLHQKVDLVTKNGLKKYIKKDILNSTVYA